MGVNPDGSHTLRNISTDGITRIPVDDSTALEAEADGQRSLNQLSVVCAPAAVAERVNGIMAC